MTKRFRLRSLLLLLPLAFPVAGCDGGGSTDASVDDLAASADLMTPRDFARTPDLLMGDFAVGPGDMVMLPPDDMALLPPNGLTVSTLSTGSFDQPFGITVDAVGASVWVADYGNHTVQRIDAMTGKVLLTAGIPGTTGAQNGAPGSATFNAPTGVALDAMGNVYVADSGNNAIRKLTNNNGQYTVSTLAGGTRGTNDGNGAAAQFNLPNGITVDAMGVTYVADCLNCAVRRITAAGDVTTLIGPDCLAMNSVYYARNIVRDGNGDFFTSDPSNHRIKRLAFPNNVPTADVYAGPAGALGMPGWKDGPADMAEFSSPYGIAFDKKGNIVVADQGNHRVRRVLVGMMPTVETLAGVGPPGASDGASLSQARFSGPRGVACDPNGVIYVADTGNKAIRKIK